MEKKQKNHPKFKAFVVLTIFLLAAPPARTVEYNGGEYDVTEDVDYMNIWPDTTVNLYANVLSYIYIHPGGILNIYSGTVGWYIAVSSDPPDAVVTVYGTNFEGDGDFSIPGEVHFSGGTLTGQYADGSTIELWFFSDIPIFLQSPVSESAEVIIDIKPGSNPNSINLKSNGVIPVAVLTTTDFDAGTVDPGTVEFAGASPIRWTVEDVDNDGDEDMLFHFRTQELNLDETSTKATLTGETKDGQKISGTDKVRIVPFGKKAKT